MAGAGTDPSLVAHWPLDDGSGPIATDVSGNGNDGDVQPGSNWVDGVFGTALEFTSGTTHVVVPDDASFNITTNELTVTVWARLDSFLGCDPTNDDPALIEKDGNYFMLGFGGSCNDVPRFRLTTAAGTATVEGGSISLGDWHLFAGVYDGNQLSLYVDGVLAGSGSHGGAVSMPAGDLKIGHRTVYGSYIAGRVDDVRLYDRALSTQEIEDLFDAATEPTDDTPPDAPGDVVANGISESEILLGWTAATDPQSGIASYRVFRDGSLVGTPVTTTFVDWGLDEAMTYSYEVSAVNGAGLEGPRSPAVDGTTLADTTPPTVTEVLAAGATQILVTFSEAVEQTSAEDPGNYAVDNGVTVVAAMLLGGSQVTLTTTTVSPGTDYMLSVENVRDLAQTPNTMVPVQIPFSLPADLVAHWTFDEGMGDVAGDVSGNGNDGDVQPGTAWVEGRFGSALKFSGVNTYVLVPDSTSLNLTTTEMSVTAWVRLDSFVGCDPTNDDPAIVEKIGDYFMLGLSGSCNGQPRFRITTSNGTATAEGGSPTTGVWHHFAGVYGNGQVAVYLDGIISGLVSHGGTIDMPAGDVHIGVRPGTGAFVDAAVDDVRIYDRALTPEEVDELVNGPSEPDDTSPPTAPTGVVATGISETLIDLTWTAAADPHSGIAGYRIYRDNVPVGSSVSTVFTDSGLTEGTVYDYEISAINGAALEGPRSDVVQGETLADTTPPTVTAVSAMDATHVRVNFSERVEQATAEALSSYAVDNGAAILDAQLGSGNDSVTLTTSLLMEWTDYLLSVESVRDRATTPNTMDPVQVPFQFAPPSDLIAHWPFDEGSGDTAGDISGNGNHGSVEGGASWIIGQIGAALEFTSGATHVTVPDGPGMAVSPDALTVTAWVRFADFVGCDPTNDDPAIVEKDGNLFQLGLTGGCNDLPRFRITTTIGTADVEGGTVTADEWHHFAGVYDGISVQLYVDGVQVAQRPWAGSVVFAPVPLKIGHRTVYSSFIHGGVDDVRIYSRALDAGEIDEIVNPAADSTPPTAPDDLTATPVSDTRIHLAYTAADDPDSGIDSYRIYRDNVAVGSSPTTSFTDDGLTEATTYTYEVSAVNGAGIEGPRSASTQGMTLPDVTPPIVLGVTARTDAQGVSVTFSEPVDGASAVDLGNYSINNGVSVLSIALEPDLATVVLTTTPLVEGISYLLSIQGVWDRAQVPNLMDPTQRAFVIDSGLIARWTFDEGSGDTASDSSGNGNTGDVLVGSEWVNGRFGSALRFTSGATHVVVPDSPSLNPNGVELTVTAWVRFDSFAGCDPVNDDPAIVEKNGNGFMLGLSGGCNDQPRFRITTTAGTATVQGGSVFEGIWHHFAGRYDGSEVRLYIDGVQVGHTAWSGPIVMPAGPLKIGHRTVYGSYIAGRVDDVRIYERALDDAALNPLNFPGATWETRTPAEVGMDAAKLDLLAARVGGDGIVIRDGYIVRTWGCHTCSGGSWWSASKPVISTMLFFAVQEGLLSSVDDLIADQGWPLLPTDASMTYSHLANNTSGYSLIEPPGAAWSYNDYGVNLLLKTLFTRVFNDTGGANPADSAAQQPNRLGALQFEDGNLYIPWTDGGWEIGLSARDFARIGWFWLARGRWNGAQLLSNQFFADEVVPQIASDFPLASGELDPNGDYLGTGTNGGQPAELLDGNGGRGIDGNFWWFNGITASGNRLWPDAPPDTYAALAGTRSAMVVIPSLRIVVAARGPANWGGHPWEQDVNADYTQGFNQDLKLIVEAVLGD